MRITKTNIDGYRIDARIGRVLDGLGFDPEERTKRCSEFSGGWQMRIALAKVLVRRPPNVLLDEPTNHLDARTRNWLAEELSEYDGALLIVTHDGEFLDKVATRVLDLRDGRVESYTGNYSDYQRQKAEKLQQQDRAAARQEREIERQERFITRFRAQANKARAVQSRVKALAKMDEVVTFARREVMRLRFPPCERAGAQVIHVEGLRKAYGDHVVFPSLELRVQRGEKIGIIGKNGAGKTTLLKMLAGELPHDAGTITMGHKVKVGYYAQHHAEALQSGSTVFEEVSAANPRAGATRVRTLLGSFLFHDEDVDKPIDVLSGGERARVALAQILIDPGNVLLMDEPTNHLDLESSEALAEALTTFDGTLVFVSHNRSFIRTLATRIWDVADGRVETYPGTLDEYIDRHRDPQRAASAAEAEPGRGKAGRVEAVEATPKAAAPVTKRRELPKLPVDERPGETREQRRNRKRDEARRRAERTKALGPLQKRVRELEVRIEQLESQQRERNLQLADPALYEDPKQRDALLAEYQRDGVELGELTDAWELAQAELEEAQAGLEG